MVHARPLPQFPVEVWERIIDSLSEDDSYDRDTLRACCLTCRAWLPRSRFHLYPHIVLWSKEHLADVVKTICSSLILCNRVSSLMITGDEDDDVSWISAVPLQLAPKLKSLQHLCFRNVDLRKTNSRIQACFSLFRPIRSVRFEDMQWSQLNQMTRLASAARAEYFSVIQFRSYVQSPDAEAPHNVTANPITLSSSQRLVLRYPDLRSIEVVLPPDILHSISQSWSFPMASLYSASFSTDWPNRDDSGWTTHLDTLQRIVNLFQLICGSNSIDPLVCVVKYAIPPSSVHALSYKCHLLLQRTPHDDGDDDLLRRDRLTLRLNYHLDTTNHDDFTSVARFLSVVAHARPHTIELQFFDRDTGTTHPDQMAWTRANGLEPMADLPARWKCIDDVLSSDAFANVISVSVTVIPQTIWATFTVSTPWSTNSYRALLLEA